MSTLNSVIEMNEYIVGIIVSTLMFIAAAWAIRLKNKRPTGGGEHIIEKSEKKSEPTDDNKKLKNVFSVKQKPPVPANGRSSTKACSDRPFESSYYFAHNKHSGGGGYTDGLKASDYVMNKPRLLSKGGVPVETTDNSAEDESIAEDKSSASSEVSEARQQPKMLASTPLTRYLWDDDGEGNIAKIHIDSLPISSTKTIHWEDASISNVEARLIGDNNEGLYVGITFNYQDGSERRCHLHVPRMYGSAEEVKVMVKKRKLLLKITKKPKQMSNRHSSNNNAGLWGKIKRQDANPKLVPVAWPTLNSSSSKVGEIDEDLFRQSS